MQFNVSEDKAFVDVKHKDEVLSFSLSYFKKGRKNDDVISSPTPFLEFNDWLNTKDARWHDAKFALMKKAKNAIDTIVDIEVCLRELNKIYKEIYSDISLKSVRTWITAGSSGIRIPKRILEAENEKEFNGRTPEKTYTYDDYLELISYSMMLRFVAPIWGEIYPALNRRFGKDAKEVYALEVIHGTSIDNCPAEQRLREYTLHAIPTADTDSAIIAALSEDDFLDYIYSVIILKKVSLGDISGIEEQERYSLIIVIYHYMKSRVNTSKNYGSDSAGIQIKKNPKDILGSENNSQSIHDIGFARSRYTLDDKVFQNKALMNLDALIAHVCPDLPLPLLEESMQGLQVFHNHVANASASLIPIQEIQLTLISWIINDYVSFMALDEVVFDDLLKVIGVVRAILWHWGFYEFAAIVSAIPLNSSEDIQIASVTKLSMDTKLLNELEARFPLGRPTKSENRNMTAQGCVDLIDKGISQYTWLVTLPETWQKQKDTTITFKRGRLIVNSNIKNRIGLLMLKIDELVNETPDIDLDQYTIL